MNVRLYRDAGLLWRRAILVAGVLSLTLLATALSWAQENKGDAGDAGDEEEISLSVTGYRSANFGMDENQVRVAIAKDFRVGEEGVANFANEAQKTTVLRIIVPRLNPRRPDHPTIITYIFGFETRTLIQVNLTWGTDVTPGLSLADLDTKAALYRERLISRKFDPAKTRVRGRIGSDTELLFRTEDSDGRVLVLASRIVEIKTETQAKEEDQPAAAPQKRKAKRLTLSFIADQKNPDIFQTE